MKQTFLQYLQDYVGATYSAEDIFANLDPDEIIQAAENYALDMASVVGRSEQLKAFLTWLEKEGGSPFIDKDALIDNWLKSL